MGQFRGSVRWGRPSELISSYPRVQTLLAGMKGTRISIQSDAFQNPPKLGSYIGTISEQRSYIRLPGHLDTTIVNGFELSRFRNGESAHLDADRCESQRLIRVIDAPALNCARHLSSASSPRFFGDVWSSMSKFCHIDTIQRPESIIWFVLFSCACKGTDVRC